VGGVAYKHTISPPDQPRLLVARKRRRPVRRGWISDPSVAARGAPVLITNKQNEPQQALQKMRLLPVRENKRQSIQDETGDLNDSWYVLPFCCTS